MRGVTCSLVPFVLLAWLASVDDVHGQTTFLYLDSQMGSDRLERCK